MATKRMLHCAGCRGEISSDAAYMTCTKCKQIFDILCTNYSESMYTSFTSEFKKSWVCVECRSKIPKGDNTQTPVRQQYLVQDMSIASDCPDVSMCSPDYVTMRTGTRCVQPTNKSDNTAKVLELTQQLIVKELKEIQDDFEKRLMTKISKLLAEQFLAFRTEMLDKVNGLGNRIDELEGKINAPHAASNVRDKSVRHKTTATVTTEGNGRVLQPDERKPKGKETVKPQAVKPQAVKPQSNQHLNVTSIVSASDRDSTSSAPIPAGSNKSEGKIVDDDDGRWTEARRKRTPLQARLSLPGVLRGTAAPGATLLSAAERKKYLHLYYVEEGTTVEQVSTHLKAICGADVCLVEALKSRGNYASFKLTVPAKLTVLVMNPENWAVDICVKPWRHNFRSRQETK